MSKMSADIGKPSLIQNKLTKLGRCDRETIELANKSIIDGGVASQ